MDKACQLPHEFEKEYVTSSGVSIYYYRNPSLHSFFISAFLKAGCMYESESESGITHFLEHAVIRNINSKRGGGLYAFLDRNGIEFDASTYSEMVQFYTGGAKEKFSLGAELISEILAPITLTSEEVDAECKRIKAEMRENDEKTSITTFTNKIVHAGTSLSRSITGTNKSVGSVTVRKLENYRKRVFTKENLFFYVTGNFSESDIQHLGSLIDAYPLADGEPHGNIAPVCADFGKRGGVYVKSSDFTMVRFTFDMDTSVLELAQSDLLYDMLIGGYNSKFFIELSEKRGLCYDITGGMERYLNAGTLSFSYEVKESCLEEAVQLTVAVLKDIKTRGVTDDECMKVAYVDNAMMLYDDPRELNFTFAYDNHLMMAGYKSVEDRMKVYDAVDAETVTACARELFRPENLTVTIKGNKKKTDPSRIAEIIKQL